MATKPKKRPTRRGASMSQHRRRTIAAAAGRIAPAIQQFAASLLWVAKNSTREDELALLGVGEGIKRIIPF